MLDKSYKKLSDAALQAFGSRANDRCKADARFKPLAARNAELLKAIQHFEVTLSRVPGGPEVTFEKNEARAAVIAVLDKLANEVEVLSDGNIEMEMASGFSLRKATTPDNGPLQQPVITKIVNDVKSGHIKFTVQRNSNVTNYAIEQSVDGGSTWSNGKYSTKSRIQLSGFEPGTQVYVRVRAIGTKERVSDYSEAASVWVC